MLYHPTMESTQSLSKNMDYQRDEHRVHLVVYHLLWCPKRRKSVLVGDIKTRCQQVIEQKCLDKGWTVLQLAIQPDHVHLFVRVWPIDSAADVVKELKGSTSFTLRKEFPVPLSKLPSLWTRSYFASTAGPLSAIAEQIPAYFRRGAINAALGSARSFYAQLAKWRRRREKAEAKPRRKGKKKFTERPPVPPRSWNKSVPFYAGQWKERTGSSIVLKVWTGTCWSWVKVRMLGRDVPEKFELGSPSLVCKGKQWWLHTPIEKTLSTPAKIAEQITTNADTRICAIDLNLGEHLAVCTVQTVKGTILATHFIGGGREIAGFRKKHLVLQSQL